MGEFFYHLKNFFKNIWFYRKQLWNDAWWEYAYFLEWIDKKLEQLEINYGINSHFVGDCFTQKRIKGLRRILKRYFEYDKRCELEKGKRTFEIF